MTITDWLLCLGIGVIVVETVIHAWCADVETRSRARLVERINDLIRCMRELTGEEPDRTARGPVSSTLTEKLTIEDVVPRNDSSTDLAFAVPTVPPSRPA